MDDLFDILIEHGGKREMSALYQVLPGLLSMMVSVDSRAFFPPHRDFRSI